MFAFNLEFNQNISNWDVSSGINFNNMFKGAQSFYQDLSKWNVKSAPYKSNMFVSSPLQNNRNFQCKK